MIVCRAGKAYLHVVVTFRSDHRRCAEMFVSQNHLFDDVEAISQVLSFRQCTWCKSRFPFRSVSRTSKVSVETKRKREGSAKERGIQVALFEATSTIIPSPQWHIESVDDLEVIRRIDVVSCSVFRLIRRNS